MPVTNFSGFVMLSNYLRRWRGEVNSSPLLALVISKGKTKPPAVTGGLGLTSIC